MFHENWEIWKPLVVPEYLFFLGILSYGWFMQGGLNGSIVFYFFLLICSAIIVFRGFHKVFALLLVCSTVLALIFIEVRHPDAIVPYTSSGQRYVDASISLIICLLTNGIMTYIVFREYVCERTAKNFLLESVVREKERAQRAVVAKQQLLSMISHDIANAVFIIQGNSRMLMSADGPNREEMNDHIAGIKTSAKAIQEIIESVRMLRAIEDGKAILKLEKVCLDKMLDDARLLVADKLKRKNISLVQEPGAERFSRRSRDHGQSVLEKRLTEFLRYFFGFSCHFSIGNTVTPLEKVIVSVNGTVSFSEGHRTSTNLFAIV